MRYLKIYLILGLVILISLSFGCKELKSIFTPDPDGPKFAVNVKIEYERLEPYVSTDYFDAHVNLNIQTTQSVEGWNSIRNTKMQKISDKEFEYTASSLPYETKLYMYTQDWGRSSAEGPEFNGRKFKIMETELTDKYIRKDPSGNGYDVAAFIIKKSNNAVVPW